MNSVNDLLDGMAVNLPSFVGLETLYSWCALYHRLSGNGLATDSYTQLFGTRKPGLRHDFPTHLESFCQRTRDLFGTPEVLAMERTLLGYYTQFTSLNTYLRALESMIYGRPSSPKHILGLMASRVGASHPLKACIQCVREDIKEFGHSRWILEHQWPSVWVCRRHGTPLRHLSREYQPRELREWTLPEDHLVGELAIPPTLSDTSIQHLAQIASVSVFIGETPLFLDDERLRKAYRIGANRRGWAAFDGTLRLAKMTKYFQESFGMLKFIPGFSFLANTDPNSGGMLGLLTRQLSGRHHPAKHAVLIAFLFETMGEFADAYRVAGGENELEGSNALISAPCRELKRLVESEHWSVNRASKHLGFPTTQACRWLNSVGTEYKHCPRVLDDSKRARIGEMLMEGETYDRISSKTGVKKGLIRSYAAANPVLRAQWHERRFERLRDEHRARVVALFAAEQGASLKALKSVPGNGLAWLERHDREWLNAHTPSFFKKGR